VNSSDLKMVVHSVASEFRGKSYVELLALVTQGPLCFEREGNGNIYSFEVHAEGLTNKGVRVRVHGEPPGAFGWTRGFAEYFGMSHSGELIEGEETWF
jgi:hypothetical protein